MISLSYGGRHVAAQAARGSGDRRSPWVFRRITCDTTIVVYDPINQTSGPVRFLGYVTVTVVDTKPPEIDVPDDMTVEAVGRYAWIDSFGVTATDLVDQTPFVSCTPPPQSSAFTSDSGSPQTQLVTCTAEDDAGNTASGSFFVTVWPDTTGPVLSLPDDIVASATGSDGAVVDYTVTASDVAGGPPYGANCSPASGSTFPIGMTTVSCTASDEKLNESTGSFTVTVQAASTPTTTTSPTTTTPSSPSTTTIPSSTVPGAVETLIELSSSANPSTLGQPVTFTATVTPVGGSGFAPVGLRSAAARPRQVDDGSTLTISDGDTVLATVAVEGGKASVTTSSLTAGAHTITAVFSGTATAAPSSATIVQQVNQAATLPATR